MIQYFTSASRKDRYNLPKNQMTISFYVINTYKGLSRGILYGFSVGVLSLYLSVRVKIKRFEYILLAAPVHNALALFVYKNNMLQVFAFHVREQRLIHLAIECQASAVLFCVVDERV